MHESPFESNSSSDGDSPRAVSHGSRRPRVHTTSHAIKQLDRIHEAVEGEDEQTMLHGGRRNRPTLIDRLGTITNKNLAAVLGKKRLPYHARFPAVLNTQENKNPNQDESKKEWNYSTRLEYVRKAFGEQQISSSSICSTSMIN